MWTDYLTVASNAATTSYKAVGTSGNEIESVYIKNERRHLGQPLTQDAAVAEEQVYLLLPIQKGSCFLMMAKLQTVPKSSCSICVRFRPTFWRT